jgi:hypothetical protein
MPAPTVIACPGCGKQLKIRDEFIGKNVRCKQCGKVIGTGKLTGKAVPLTQADAETAARQRAQPSRATAATLPTSPALARLKDPDQESLEQETSGAEGGEVQAVAARSRLRPRLKPRHVMPIVMLVITVLGVGGVYLLFREELTELLQGMPPSALGKPTAASAASTSLLAQANPTEPTAASEQPRPTRPRPTAPRQPQRPNYRGRIASPYPARALLIGIKNYLYLNPINPGFREEGRMRDLLGLGSLARALVEEHGLLPDQVLELSDVAATNPTAPTKAAIEATVDEFLAKARPQDHAILVFIGYAVGNDDKAYLVPLEGEPDRAETLIPVADLMEKLKKSPAHHKLLIADFSPVDPEQYSQRPVPAPLPEKALAELTKPPEGVQVWLSAAPGQAAHQFADAGYVGSVFLHQLGKKADLRQPENWRLIDKQVTAPGAPLPLTLLAQSVNEATAKAVADRNKAKQTPKMYGTPAKPSAAPDANVPPAVALRAPEVGELATITEILRELPLTSDPMREIKPSFLPRFDAKTLAKYKPDYQTDYRTLEELKSRFAGKPLRALTLEAVLQLEKKDYRLRMRYQFNANEQQFKRMLESEQQRPASLGADLIDLYEQLQQAGEQRAEDKSPRWQAHYDYVTARVLAKLITVQEYNFVLGNNLRKDSPRLSDPSRYNGWAIVPQEKLQQTETRNYEKERKKILDRLVKDHPGTPWEVLARRELLTALGLKLVEARVER